jgi:hypothetical protein
MSERPSPLWPEGLRKGRNLPPVENQRRQTPASDDRSFVPNQEAGNGGKKPEGAKQQPADPNREAFERFLRSTPMRPAVFGGHVRPSRRRSEQRGGGEPFQPVPAEQQARERLGKPPPESEKPGEQRGAAEPSKPNAAEQQTPQRRRTQRERARLAQDPDLRSLADELWGMVHTKGELTKVISESLYRYPDLPPDEALREYKDDFQGFSFA